MQSDELDQRADLRLGSAQQQRLAVRSQPRVALASLSWMEVLENCQPGAGFVAANRNSGNWPIAEGPLLARKA